MQITVQECPWRLHYQKHGQALDINQACALSAQAGFEYWDANLPRDTQTLDTLGRALSSSGLKLSSMYEDAPVHDSNWQECVDHLQQRAHAAKPLGLRILAFNPAPLSWEERLDKSDQQLALQTQALRRLGQGLAEMGVRLSYHTHGAEMRGQGRELYHMLKNIEGMGFCLEPEWVLRPPEGSPRQLEELLADYLPRVNLVHVRQARRGMPVAGMGEGDIDWADILGRLGAIGFEGPLVYEGYTGDFVGGGTADLDELCAQLQQSRRWLQDAAVDQ
jgi:sugar phosphate isomerase/epimerase